MQYIYTIYAIYKQYINIYVYIYIYNIYIKRHCFTFQ